MRVDACLSLYVGSAIRWPLVQKLHFPSCYKTAITSFTTHTHIQAAPSAVPAPEDTGCWSDMLSAAIISAADVTDDEQNNLFGADTYCVSQSGRPFWVITFCWQRKCWQMTEAYWTSLLWRKCSFLIASTCFRLFYLLTSAWGRKSGLLELNNLDQKALDTHADQCY